jgi:Phage major capsid protein E
MPAATIPAELLYTTATLIESFKVVPLAPQFLRDKLFPKTSETTSDQVAVDFYNGTQKLAPYCSRFSKGTAVPCEKMQTSLFSPPFIKPIRNLTADELYYKAAIQAANATGNREAELMLIDYQELDAMIGRREEWMASQCLFTGKVVCLDGDTNEVVAELAYGTPTKTVPAKLWSDTTSDPLGDIRGALRLVSSASGASADIVIMGKSAADAFESNPNVLSAYDKMRISPGELAPASVGWGIQSLGTYRGIPLYVYEAEYLDAAGALQPFVPPDNVLVAASALGGTMAYAGVAQVDAAETGLRVFAARRVPVVAYESLEDYRKFRLSSRPVPVPQNLAAWSLLDVL